MRHALVVAVGVHAAVLAAVAPGVPRQVVPEAVALAWVEAVPEADAPPPSAEPVASVAAAPVTRGASPTAAPAVPPREPDGSRIAPPRSAAVARAAPARAATDRTVPHGSAAAGAATVASVAPGPTNPPAPLPGAATPPPAYPAASRARGEQGSVVMAVDVAASGAVAEVVVAASSGHPRLDAAAREAVAAWRFRPALADGAPVAGSLRHTIHFRLDTQGGLAW